MRRLSKDDRRKEFVVAASAIDSVLALVSDETREIILGRLNDFGRLTPEDGISEWIDYCSRAGDVRRALASRPEPVKAKG